MLTIYLFLLIILTKSTYYKKPSQKIKFLTLLMSYKISFLEVFIHTNNNINFTTSTYKKLSNNNTCALNFKRECPFRYKKAIINNLISRARVISSSKTIFYIEVENLKQALINYGFPHYIVDEQIKRMIKNVNQQNKHGSTPPSQQTFIKVFTATKCTIIINQMKNIKNIDSKNILPTKKKKLIIYYNKFKSSSLVIKNNSPLDWSFAKKQRYISIQMSFRRLYFWK